MYAFTQDVPTDAEFYRRVKAGLGDDLPAGMICHLAIERPEGGLRYIDIWESERDWDTFAETRLHPVVHPLLAEIFGDDLPPEPDRKSLAVIDYWA